MEKLDRMFGRSNASFGKVISRFREVFQVDIFIPFLLDDVSLHFVFITQLKFIGIPCL